jgi:hypothetical protein
MGSVVNFKPIFSKVDSKILQWFLRDITHNLLVSVMPYLQLMEKWQTNLVKDFENNLVSVDDTAEPSIVKKSDTKKLTQDLQKLLENLAYIQTQSSLLTLEELNEQHIILVKILALVIDCDNPHYIKKAPEDYEIIKDTQSLVLDWSKNEIYDSKEFSEDMTKFWGEQDREAILATFNLFREKANISKIKR